MLRRKISYNNNFNNWPAFPLSKFIRDLTFYRKKALCFLEFKEVKHTPTNLKSTTLASARWGKEKKVHMNYNYHLYHPIQLQPRVSHPWDDFHFVEFEWKFSIFAMSSSHSRFSLSIYLPPLQSSSPLETSLCINNVKFCVSKRDFMVCQFGWNKFIHVSSLVYIIVEQREEWVSERRRHKSGEGCELWAELKIEMDFPTILSVMFFLSFLFEHQQQEHFPRFVRFSTRLFFSIVKFLFCCNNVVVRNEKQNSSPSWVYAVSFQSELKPFSSWACEHYKSAVQKAGNRRSKLSFFLAIFDFVRFILSPFSSFSIQNCIVGEFRDVVEFSSIEQQRTWQQMQVNILWFYTLASKNLIQFLILNRIVFVHFDVMCKFNTGICFYIHHQNIMLSATS